MPRIARKDFEKGFFHIMVQGIKKENIFGKNEYKNKYVYLINMYLKEQNLTIISYCIMNNHAHILIHVDDIEQLTQFMKKLNTTYAVYYNKEQERVGYVFRNRYKSKMIYNRDYLRKCIKYIHMNPVKAGIVEQESKYRYSSYNQYISKTGIVTERLIEDIFESKENYLKKFLAIDYKEELFKDFESNTLDKQAVKIEIERFLQKEEIELEELRKDKRLIKKLYTIMGQYVTKAELARSIGISREKISKILN